MAREAGENGVQKATVRAASFDDRKSPPRAWLHIAFYHLQHRTSVLDRALDVAAADLVFSVGLVEHFEPKETNAAVQAHFDLLRRGGIAIVTFPTPTGLYRITRALITALGMWRFPDERPLNSLEVISAIRERGELVWQKTLWPLMLTQHLVVARKHRAFTSSPCP